MEWKDALKRFRESRGLSQALIAKEIGMHAPQYQRYEWGQNSPSVEVIIKLAQTFDVSADYLLGLSDEPRPMPPKAEDEELIDAIVVLHGVVKNVLKKRGFEI